MRAWMGGAVLGLSLVATLGNSPGVGEVFADGSTRVVLEPGDTWEADLQVTWERSPPPDALAALELVFRIEEGGEGGADSGLDSEVRIDLCGTQDIVSVESRSLLCSPEVPATVMLANDTGSAATVLLLASVEGFYDDELGAEGAVTFEVVVP
ncbi:MAG: hypothetical protein EP330_06255 [Deltaproteobacteria bacterium]|nr:MAG: hypothetical protein EP330_06255 [Deltaproteobacteria bacterium]